jgi:formate dehydrogenase subunit gamma
LAAISEVELGDTVERFAKTTRWFHWTFAGCFLCLAATGAALATRELLGLEPGDTATLIQIHKGAGVALLVAPLLVWLSGQTGITAADFRELLRWSRDDLRWLALQLPALRGRAVLPAAGKLNAGQKLNGLATIAFSAALAITGVILWMRPGSLVAWFVHLGVFLAWLPLFAVHFSMAVVVPATRPALRGMLSGRVRRTWAEHHHERWLNGGNVRELGEDPGGQS